MLVYFQLLSGNSCLKLCDSFYILIRITACGTVIANCMDFLNKMVEGWLMGIGGMNGFYFYLLGLRRALGSLFPACCMLMMHAFHFHLGKKVRFLSNIAAFVMSPYSNASINPVSPLCGISVVGLSLHMTLRTDRR